MARNQQDAGCSSAGKRQTSRDNERGHRLKQVWDWHDISAGKSYGQLRTFCGTRWIVPQSRCDPCFHVGRVAAWRDHISPEEDDEGHERQQMKEPIALNNRRGIGRGLSELSHVRFLSEVENVMEVVAFDQAGSRR